MNNKKLRKKLKKAEVKSREYLVLLDNEMKTWSLYHNTIIDIERVIIGSFDGETKIKQIAQSLHQLTRSLAKKDGVIDYLRGEPAK